MDIPLQPFSPFLLRLQGYLDAQHQPKAPTDLERNNIGIPHGQSLDKKRKKRVQRPGVPQKSRLKNPKPDGTSDRQTPCEMVNPPTISTVFDCPTQTSVRYITTLENPKNVPLQDQHAAMDLSGSGSHLAIQSPTMPAPSPLYAELLTYLQTHSPYIIPDNLRVLHHLDHSSIAYYHSLNRLPSPTPVTVILSIYLRDLIDELQWLRPCLLTHCVQLWHQLICLFDRFFDRTILYPEEIAQYAILKGEYFLHMRDLQQQTESADPSVPTETKEALYRLNQIWRSIQNTTATPQEESSPLPIDLVYNPRASLRLVPSEHYGVAHLVRFCFNLLKPDGYIAWDLPRLLTIREDTLLTFAVLHFMNWMSFQESLFLSAIMYRNIDGDNNATYGHPTLESAYDMYNAKNSANHAPTQQQQQQQRQPNNGDAGKSTMIDNSIKPVDEQLWEKLWDKLTISLS